MTKEHWGSAKTIFLTSTQGEPVRRRPLTEHGPESDSDEEPTEEVKQKPIVANEGRRYPLRERRALRIFPEKEYVLLTNEGEPESFEEAKKDTHNRKWLSAM